MVACEIDPLHVILKLIFPYIYKQNGPFISIKETDLESLKSDMLVVWCFV